MSRCWNGAIAAFALVLAGWAGCRTASGQAVEPGAEPFALRDVRLGDGPFRAAMLVDRSYLLRLDPNRLIHEMRRVAGVPSPVHEGYGGWETNNGSQSIGHYLSACSMMAAATGDPELHRRVDEVVDAIAACQAARPDGAVFASRARRRLVRGGSPGRRAAPRGHARGTSCTRTSPACATPGCTAATPAPATSWSAWPTPASPSPPASLPPSGRSSWDPSTAGRTRCSPTCRQSPETRNTWRWPVSSATRGLFEPMLKGDEPALYNIHANTQFPKFIGYERHLRADRRDRLARAPRATSGRPSPSHLSWVNGGNSQWESFFPPAEFAAKVTENCGPETCNTYNMLKLTRQLFLMEPRVKYLDYYERGLYNHLLASQDPEHGGFVYYTSMRTGPLPGLLQRARRLLVLRGHGHGRPRPLRRADLRPQE